MNSVILLAGTAAIAVCLVTLSILRKRNSRLSRECIRLRKVAEAWKDFALAEEVCLECDFDWHDPHCQVGMEELHQQTTNAGSAATAALLRLRDVGEYLDAYQSSVFLPRAESYEESIEMLRCSERRCGL